MRVSFWSRLLAMALLLHLYPFLLVGLPTCPFFLRQFASLLLLRFLFSAFCFGPSGNILFFLKFFIFIFVGASLCCIYHYCKQIFVNLFLYHSVFIRPLSCEGKQNKVEQVPFQEATSITLPGNKNSENLVARNLTRNQ